MPGLQMLLEHFPLVAALYADDVVGTNLASHRYCRNTRRFICNVLAETRQCRMDSIDEAGDLVG